MSAARRLIRVAVPVPLAEAFDYLWLDPSAVPAPGCRVRVPFGRGERIGVVLEHAVSSELAPHKLKPALECLDDKPLIGPELLDMLRWAADYYHHSIGDVINHALPAKLREGGPLDDPDTAVWSVTGSGREQALDKLARRAKQQARALETLAAASQLTDDELRQAGITRPVIGRLHSKGWIERRHAAAVEEASPVGSGEELPALTEAQAAALAEIERHDAGFAPFLLHGVTGSGKTEVFLRLIDAELRQGRQTLLLVPEISLTPQVVARLSRRFGPALAVMHSGLSDKDRLVAWRRAYRCQAQVIVGTRSAVFAPLPAAGLFIVDEEHDPAYKQERTFRYSARDLAVLRAQRLGVRAVLASATPSLESFRNAFEGRYRLLSLPKRIGRAGQPKLRSIDMNQHASRKSISTPLLACIDEHLGRGNQVLLFLNRRGFAPALFCPSCATVEECDRCDAKFTVHARSGRLRCHHCGKEAPLRWACPRCGSERIAVGAGTQRIGDELQARYPERRIARLDRDVTAKRGALAAVLDAVEAGEVDILIGTQMLTKGHDFPRVTLVGVLNADQGLFGTDLRSDERLAQTIVQVAGRAGRREQPGEVVIQTHFPTHPLLGSLLTTDYEDFARRALAERHASGWPPYAHLAIWRAEAVRRDAVYALLDRIKAAAGPVRGPVQILGPAAARMERMGGKIRGQLLFSSRQRRELHGLIAHVLAEIRAWPEARRVRWAIDVDPNEL